MRQLAKIVNFRKMMAPKDIFAFRHRVKAPAPEPKVTGSNPVALDYLIGEKFLNFLEAAETDADFRAEIPSFVVEIKKIFEPWQLAQYLETCLQTEPFDPALFEPMSSPLLGEEEVEFDAEEVEDMRKDDIRRCTRDLLLVERAKEWLLETEQKA